MNRTQKKGFSLVEIITILFIVSLGLVGILSLIVQNIQSQSYNRDNLIAYQLAQEGIELIRKVRDSNWKAGLPFNTNLAPDTDIVYQYYMDYRDSAPHDASGNPDTLSILKKDVYGYYFHDLASPATSSGFSRLITVEQGLDDSFLRIFSQVSWGDRTRGYYYDLETVLYDWR